MKISLTEEQRQNLGLYLPYVDEHDIGNWFANNYKIQLIRLYRGVFGTGLVESKNAIEANWSHAELINLFNGSDLCDGVEQKAIVKSEIDLTDPDKKAIFVYLSEFYDQKDNIGCKNHEEALRLAIDAFYGKPITTTTPVLESPKKATYKNGDKVKVIQDCPRVYGVGKVYTVKSVDSDGDLYTTCGRCLEFTAFPKLQIEHYEG